MSTAPVVTWFGIALGAAMLWGLQYALWGQLLKVIGPVAGLWWYCVISVILYGAFMGFKGISVEPEALRSWQVAGLLVAIGVIGFVANVAMVTGFKMANPTLVTMITASAPMFTAIFAYLLFKNVQVNMMTVLGFGLILAGVGVVAFSKQAGKPVDSLMVDVKAVKE